MVVESPGSFVGSSSYGIFSRNDDGTDIPSYLNAGHVRALKLTSLTCSAVSVLSALVTFYWFTRMRRSFRHDLIMLLIQSDMFKALWFMIFAIVNFIHGPVLSSSAFCQASGFFLTVGIEASDVAVLLIAIHTALYIFRPKRANGEYGLFPYRRYAYAAFFFFPILIASLAFLHKPYGYVNLGENCYLPVETSWPRTVLSWVPRYVIFLTILTIYACIYIYVSFLIRRFGRVDLKRTQANNAFAELSDPQSPSTPTAPPTVYQVSLPSSRRGSAFDHRDRQNSVSTFGSVNIDLERVQYDTQTQRGQFPIKWKWPNANTNAAVAEAPTRPAPNHEYNLSDIESISPTTVDPEATPIPPPELGMSPCCDGEVVPLSMLAADNRQNAAQPLPSRVASAGNISTAPRDYFGRPSYSSTTSSANLFADTDGDVSGMTKTREKIRHQVRLLFIYPLVYMVVWLVPFISHILTWEDNDDSVPFLVLVLSLASLCIQGAVNSLLFSMREKPWRHARKTRMTGLRTSVWKFEGSHQRRQPTVGRTREEMMVDGRIARSRLDVEIAERKLRFPLNRRSRQWWDAVDVETIRGHDEGRP
ncbi:hypothetical protein jhhlp_003750 [Lomentospora prolificans]|uniref:G-protein coupled receptors family 1 profile domain-containing protein n=1 Tax=Lomentospora prolificans TaxID=41688 RepID=A0A2N3N9L2_9PEZI|nr:hypothetical protein jhhlp_003750 [Lomentospora prolificans]